MVARIQANLDTTESMTLASRLAEPFAADEVKWKPQSVKGNRALALAYIDARAIQDRLDDVMGVDNWQDHYQLLPDGSVICELRLRINGEWITKVDVGSPSEQPDGGDRLKAAFSDALKRSAVKYGIGRYLYRLPAQWVDYDPAKRQFAQTPSLPEFAIPRPRNRARTTAKSTPVTTKLPANGDELARRIQECEARLIETYGIEPGSLVAHLVRVGTSAGYGDDLTRWTGPAIAFAASAVKEYEARLKQKAPTPAA